MPLTPPFTPPDPTDPVASANAGQGYAEFNALKNYLVSWIGIMFDDTTGLFLPTTIIPTTALPAFAGDVTSAAQTNLLTVLAINGVVMSGLGAGVLYNQSNGQPRLVTSGDVFLGTARNLTAAVLLPTGTTAATPSSNDNSQKLATTAYVNALATARGQFIGTNTNDNATVGNIGESVTAALAAGSATALTTNTPANILSISLSAGDWDVSANCNFSGASATTTAMEAGIASSSATLPSDGSEVYSALQTTTATFKNTLTPARRRISLSTTTTIYLVAQATFSAGTMASFGAIFARRVR